MKKGEKALITISSEYGFGSSDLSKSKATVPANSEGKAQSIGNFTTTKNLQSDILSGSFLLEMMQSNTNWSSENLSWRKKHGT